MPASIASFIARLARTGLITSAIAVSAVTVSGTPYYLGVSGPMTDVNAQYGEQWRARFDLALAQLDADGGVRGHPLAYTFEDS